MKLSYVWWTASTMMIMYAIAKILGNNISDGFAEFAGVLMIVCVLFSKTD